MTMDNREPATGGRHRMILIVLALIFLAPVLGSWIMFYLTDFGRNGEGPSSHGTLIVPPRKIDDVVLIDPENGGQSHRLYGKWNIVYLVSGACGPACEDKLYEMRQLRLAMGRDAGRVQRVLVVYGGRPPTLSGAQMEKYQGQLLVHATGQMQTVFKLTDTERPLDRQRLYIIDPRGNLMMSYPEGTEPAGIIKDLKRLLKYSSIG